jgi:hypothetical protein
MTTEPAQPYVQQRAEQPYLGLRLSTSIAGLGAAVDSGYPVLFGWLAEHGRQPAAAPFIRYLVIDMATELRVELGVPASVTSADVADDTRLHAAELPAGRYATLLHTGPYDGLLDANSRLLRWVDENGLTLDSWDTEQGSGWASRVEHYLTDPSRQPDPADWQTEIAVLLRD